MSAIGLALLVLAGLLMYEAVKGISSGSQTAEAASVVGNTTASTPSSGASATTSMASTGAIGSSQSLDTVVQEARNAGFSGNGLATVVALAWRESGFSPTAQNPQAVIVNGKNYGHATGIIQFLESTFNGVFPSGNIWDPQQQFNAAFKASNGGLNFGPWTSDQNGIVPVNPQTVAAGGGNPFPPGLLQQIEGLR